MPYELFICEENELNRYIEARNHVKTKIGEEPKEIPSVYGFGKGFGHDSDNRILKIENDTAIISVSGMLMNNPVWFYKSTGYKEIIDAIDISENNKGVKNIEIHADSDGGNVGIVDNVWCKIRECKKPIITKIVGNCCSGMYWVSSATDKIISMSPVNRVGSIGVIVYGLVETEESYSRYGLKRIIIKSKNANNKYHPPETKQGEKRIQDDIDSIERQFLFRISMGRDVSVDTIIRTYGQGNVFPSEDPDSTIESALTIGMIDKVINGYEALEKKEKKVDIGSKSLYHDNELNINGNLKGKNTMEISEKELQDKIEEAKAVGYKSGFDDATSNSKRIANIIKGGSYPKKIVDMGLSCIENGSDPSVFEQGVGFFDAALEEMKQSKAKDEDKEIVQKPNDDKSKDEKKVGNKNIDEMSIDEIDELVENGDFE